VQPATFLCLAILYETSTHLSRWEIWVRGEDIENPLRERSWQEISYDLLGCGLLFGYFLSIYFGCGIQLALGGMLGGFFIFTLIEHWISLTIRIRIVRKAEKEAAKRNGKILDAA
jgi:hypothetical protein